MFTFTPRSDEELNTFQLLPKGEYDFEVIAAIPKVSKAGNPMVELNLKVWGQDGRESLIFDYLLDSIPYKIKHFCSAVGMDAEYNNGGFNPVDCVHKAGRCKVGIQVDKTGLYSDKNVINDYCIPAAGSILGVVSKPQTNAVGQLVDDDMPF